MPKFLTSLIRCSLAFVTAGLSTGAHADTPNAAEIATRCRTAYAALSSYEVTSTVAAQSVTVADGTAQKYQTSANIQFVRPGKIHTSGKDTSGGVFAYVSDGSRTVFEMGSGPWKEQATTEMAIAGATGISASAGATIPALLLGSNWGTPLALGGATKPEVREDKIEGLPYFVLTAHLTAPALNETESLWIDEKTFLLRRSVSDDETAAQTFVIQGQSHAVPAMKTHSEQDFTHEKLNQPIIESTFRVPITQ